MDQQNMLIATGGILVSLGILAIGFNKLSPDTYGNDNPIFSNSMNRSSAFDFKNTYPGSKREEIYPHRDESHQEDDFFNEPRKSNQMVGGRTLCKRCHYSKYTRRK
jgi:hypothetical protein